MRLLTSSILILKLLHDNLSKSSSESRSILSSSVSGFCFSSSPFELDVDFMLLIPDELWSDGVKSPEFRSSVFIFIFSLFFRSDFFGLANIEFIYTCLLLWMNISLSYRFSSPLVFFSEISFFSYLTHHYQNLGCLIDLVYQVRGISLFWVSFRCHPPGRWRLNYGDLSRHVSLYRHSLYTLEY